MAAPFGPQGQQQQAQQAPEPAQAPAPQAPAHNPAEHGDRPVEDRLLEASEVEAFLRGTMPSPESANEPTIPPDQAQMAGDFFAEVPGESRPAQQMPQDPTRQQYQQAMGLQGQQVPGQEPPQELPPQQIAQAAQATWQQAQPEQGQYPAPGQTPGQTPPAAQTPAEAAIRSEMELLRQHNQSLQGMVGQLTQQIQNTTAQGAQQRQAQGPGQVPGQAQLPGAQTEQPFNLSVPDSLFGMLRSEDPGVSRQALDGMLNGIANVIYQRYQQDMEQRFSSVPQMIQSQFSGMSRQNEIAQDMYGTYPELRPFQRQVVAMAEDLQAQGFGGQWSPELRDMIAERLSPLVPGLGQRIQQLRAQRMTLPAVPQSQQMAAVQPTPQVLPPGIHPAGFAGAQYGAQGAYAPAGSPGSSPVMMRDPVTGRLVQMAGPQQQNFAGPQTRNGASSIDPQLADVWNTLGY